MATLLSNTVGFYSKKELLRRLPYSGTTLWRQCRRGNFPRPVKISPGRVGWEKEEADRAIAALVAGAGMDQEAEASDARAS